MRKVPRLSNGQLTIAILLYYVSEIGTPLALIPLFKSFASVSESAAFSYFAGSLLLPNVVYAGFAPSVVSEAARKYITDDRKLNLLVQFSIASILLTFLVIIYLFTAGIRDAGYITLSILINILRLSILFGSVYISSTPYRGIERICQVVGSGLGLGLSMAFLLSQGLSLGHVDKFQAVLLLISLGLTTTLTLLYVAIRNINWSLGKTLQFQAKSTMLLWLVQIIGFTNLGTEALVASRVIRSQDIPDFVFLSRLGQAPLAIVGMWGQVHLAEWSQVKSNELPTSLIRGLYASVLGYALFGGVLFLVWYNFLNRSISPALLLLMMLTYAVASSTVLLGTYLSVSRHAHELLFCSLPGILSPLVSIAVGYHFAGVYFYFGFLVCNCLMLYLHSRLAFDFDQSGIRSAFARNKPR